MNSINIQIYGMKNCNWCVMAQELAEELWKADRIDKWSYELVEDPAQWLTERGFAQPWERTMPKIYVNNKLLGGYTELERTFNS